MIYFEIIKFSAVITLIITMSILIISSTKTDLKKFSINKIDNKLKKNKGFYDNKTLELKKKGINEFFNKKTTVEIINGADIEEVPLGQYYCTKILMSIILFAVGLTENLYLGIVLGIFGYQILDIMLNHSNEINNKMILDDIRGIYSILEIQSTSGVYFLKSLNHCTLRVKNKRLKKALIILCNDIKTNKTLDESIESFKSKFSNEHINNLSMIIKHSMESGRVEEVVKDLQNQVEVINNVLNKRREEKIQSIINSRQFMLVVCVLMTMLICAVNYISSMTMGL